MHFSDIDISVSSVVMRVFRYLFRQHCLSVKGTIPEVKAERPPFCLFSHFWRKYNFFLLYIVGVKEYKLHRVRNLQLYWTRFQWMHHCCMLNIITKDTMLQQQPAEIQILQCLELLCTFKK